MSTPAVALAGHPHNPARGASEVRVQWTKPHLCANLFTTPAPGLAVVARKLYVVWDPDNMTELPLYGPHLSYEIKERSKGNGTLMYIAQPDQAGEWIPILQHIRNTAPGLTKLGVRHIADFTTLSKRAEEERYGRTHRESRGEKPKKDTETHGAVWQRRLRQAPERKRRLRCLLSPHGNKSQWRANRMRK